MKVMAMGSIVYYNGEFLPKEQVHVSPDDRGFLFGDGVYDVTLTYGGRLFRIDDHLQRMANGLKALEITGADVDGLSSVGEELLKRNNLDGYSQALYLQVTRGVARRTHQFPNPGVSPTVFASISPFNRKGDPEHGSPIITVPDVRWSRCDIKSICLLPNCLATQRAKDQDAHEAVFVRDGSVQEGASSTFFAVFDGVVYTPPLTNHVLPGITRKVVLELCAKHEIPTRMESILLHHLPDADEIFIAGTTSEVVPVTGVDGKSVGAGTPGPVARKISDLFIQYAHGE
ncbi:aminotransferase class IV [Gemmatimonadota bacterium]